MVGVVVGVVSMVDHPGGLLTDEIALCEVFLVERFDGSGFGACDVWLVEWHFAEGIGIG